MDKSTDCIAVDVLETVLAKHPQLLSAASELRKRGSINAGSKFSVAHAIVLMEELNIKSHEYVEGFDAEVIGALAAWGDTKSVFRFDPFLFDELVDIDVSNKIPTEVLLRLPSEAVFIEAPQSDLLNFPLKGFWIYIACTGDVQNIVFVTALDFHEIAHPITGYAHLFFTLPIGSISISEAVEFSIGSGINYFTDEHKRHVKLLLSQIMSLGLYLCADEPDILDSQKRPLIKDKAANTSVESIRRAPERWEVGSRIGAALELECERRLETRLDGGSGTGSPVRPHIRRAHWHSYWVGKQGEQTLVVRWLPPIPINVTDNEELPAVIRPVIGS